MTTADLLASLRERLSRLTEERDALERLIAFYSAELAGPSPAGQIGPIRLHATATVANPPRNPFKRSEGGATERLLEVLSERPGLRFAELVNEAMTRGVSSSSPNPRRATGSTVSTLIKRGVVVRTADGRHFLASEAQR